MGRSGVYPSLPLSETAFGSFFQSAQPPKLRRQRAHVGRESARSLLSEDIQVATTFGTMQRKIEQGGVAARTPLQRMSRPVLPSGEL